MRIVFDAESSARPQFDGYEEFKAKIEGMDVSLLCQGEPNAVAALSELLLVGCGWGTVEFVNTRLWIRVLNKLDDILYALTVAFGPLLLTDGGYVATTSGEMEKKTETTVPNILAIVELVCIVLHWSADLLHHAVHKDIYCSVDRISYFLQAPRDQLLFRNALNVIYALSIPPPNHRTVFVYDLTSVMDKEAIYSEPLFHIIKTFGATVKSLRSASPICAESVLRQKIILFQAAFVLLGCHPSSARIRVFFHDKSWILSEAIEAMTAQLAVSSITGIRAISSSIMDMNGELNWVLRNTACSCLLAIFDRAVDMDESEEDEDRRRRSHKPPKKPRMMMPFEAAQRMLGLERGQMGGLLLTLVRQELGWLQSQSGIINNASTSTSSVKRGGFGDIAARDIEGGVDMTAVMMRMLWVEQLLWLCIKTATLPGALTTVLDNGVLSLLQSVVSPSRHRRGRTDKTTTSSVVPTVIVVPTHRINDRRTNIAEVKLCIDSCAVQLIDLIISSKRRAMEMFLVTGGSTTHTLPTTPEFRHYTSYHNTTYHNTPSHVVPLPYTLSLDLS